MEWNRGTREVGEYYSRLPLLATIFFAWQAKMKTSPLEPLHAVEIMQFLAHFSLAIELRRLPPSCAASSRLSEIESTELPGHSATAQPHRE